MRASLNNLATLHEKQGRYADAEPLFRRALAILDHALGPDHPDTAMSLSNLASFLQGHGRTGDALVDRTIAGGRAQLHPGAWALLVSHWAVVSDAATRLATSTFDRLKADPGIGRAEALRQAMLLYLNDTTSPRNPYPALWAPFALIGEGAPR